jgi:hypothetical protein
MDEIKAIVSDKNDCTKYKRIKQGKGVSLTLCDKETVSYNFDKKEFTKLEANTWLEKHGLKPILIKGDEEVKQSIKAKNPDGKVWGSGMHHVWVNDKPARVYVPEDTVLDTFKQMQERIRLDKKIGLGIDHLSDEILENNQILSKLNLLDVGEINEIVTDGNGIYITDSKIHNDMIKTLHDEDALPSYSIVGSMESKPCPSGKADYVLTSLDVERVDFVEEGGCQSCKVGVKPEGMILTAKISIKGDNSMTEVVNETIQDEVVETPVDETVPVESVETKEEPIETETKTEPSEDEETVEVTEDVDTIEQMKEEIKQLRELLETKKAPVEEVLVEAKDSFDAELEVKKLIKAGRALPSMKKSLLEVANVSEDAFRSMAASLPKMVKFGAKAKLAKVEEQTKPKAKKKITMDDPEWYDSDEYKQMLEQFGM